MNNIFLVIPAGAVVRDFFECGLVNKLLESQNEKLIVFIHNNLSFIQDKYKSPNLHFEILPKVELNYLDKFLFRLRNIFTKYRFKNLIYIIYLFERKIVNSQVIKEYYSKYTPSLVIFPTPRYLEYEYKFGLTAQKFKVPLFCIVSSWDNMTKRPLLLRFDYLTVWNKYMKNWAIEKHFYRDSDVFIVGALQFDLYFQNLASAAISKYNCDCGKKKNIVYATLGLLNWNIDEITFIKLLINNLNKNELLEKINFIIRLHPHDRDEYIKEFNNYENVFLHYSKGWRDSNKRSGDWLMTKHDVEDVIHLFQNAAIVINMGTTFHIEAAIFNIPVILVAFHKDNAESVQILSTMTLSKHFKPLIDSGLCNVVNDEVKLIEEIKNYIEEPNKDSQKRTKIVKEIVSFNDGKTSERISNLIHEKIAANYA